MKTRPAPRRQLLVLTPEEKKTVAFVLVALLLGIATKQYREAHAIPPRKIAIAEVAKTIGLPAQKRTEAKRRKKAE